MNKLVSKIFGNKSEQNYKTIFDYVSDALFIHDIGTGKILDVNKKMCKMYGYTRDEAINSEVGTFSSGIAPYTKETAKEKVRLVASGKRQVFEWQAKTKTGKLFWVEVRLGKVVLDGTDKIIANVRDISDRKLIEEKELYIDKAKTEFISIAAHQLRTPLGSMRWNTEILLRNAKEYNLSSEVIGLIQKNYQSNLKVIDLVNDLLEVSRIDQNKLKSNIKRLSLVEVIEEVIEELNYEASLKSVILKFRNNKDYQYLVEMDRKHIKEAIQNIIGNAVKYSFQKTEVSISLNKKDKYFELKISNVGIGIPSFDNQYIFEKFFRAKNAIKISSEGFGLGLFIAKSFIERMDGNISYSSNEDKRTIFIVRIPSPTVG